MSVGLAVTKQEIDARAGDLARGFQKLFGDTATLKSYLDGADDATLEGLGYTPNEIAILKTAVGDLAQLAAIWSGNDNLPQPKDFRQFVRELWGVGSF